MHVELESGSSPVSVILQVGEEADLHAAAPLPITLQADKAIVVDGEQHIANAPIALTLSTALVSNPGESPLTLEITVNAASAVPAAAPAEPKHSEHETEE